MNDMDKYLPGHPERSLVKKVRSHLRSYGIVPKRKQWVAAWAWATAVANSYMTANGRLKKPWPLPVEIGAQYLALLLADMKQYNHLKLPYRATKIPLPDSVQQLLPGGSQPQQLTFEPTEE